MARIVAFFCLLAAFVSCDDSCGDCTVARPGEAGCQNITINDCVCESSKSLEFCCEQGWADACVEEAFTCGCALGCETDEDCLDRDEGDRCVNNVCTDEDLAAGCETDEDCADRDEGEYCVDNICTDEPPPVGCETDEDCIGRGEGDYCVNNICTDEGPALGCETDEDCIDRDEGEYCVDNICTDVPVPAPAPEITPIQCSGPCLTGAENNKWLVTRLWMLEEDATVTNEEVAELSAEILAPVLTQQEGFNEYLGSPSEYDANLTLFFNVFDTQDQATQASLDADKYVDESDLSDQMEPVEDWSLAGQFQWLFHECTSNTGAFLFMNRWSLIEGSEDTTLEDVTNEQLQLLAPVVTEQDGFLAYGAAIMEDNLLDGYIIDYQIFETEAQFEAGLEALKEAAQESQYRDQLEKEEFKGFVDFDFVCTELVAGS